MSLVDKRALRKNALTPLAPLESKPLTGLEVNRRRRLPRLRLGLLTGLTFVELLITILIFSIIVVSAYSAFRVGLVAYRKGEKVASLYQKIRLSLDSIALDLRNSYKFSDRDCGFVAEEGRISFYTLKRFDSSLDKGHFKIFKMQYWLDDSIFLRKASGGKLAFSDEEVSADVILDNLEQLTIEFPYKSEEAKDVIWKDYWQAPDKLPLAVKINLEINESYLGKPIKLRKIIHIPTGNLGETEE